MTLARGQRPEPDLHRPAARHRPGHRHAEHARPAGRSTTPPGRCAPAAAAANTLLVTPGNSFLEKALTLLPGVRLFKATPADYAPTAGYAPDRVRRLPARHAAARQSAADQPAQLAPAADLGHAGLRRRSGWPSRTIRCCAMWIGARCISPERPRCTTPPWARVLVRSTSGAPAPAGRRDRRPSHRRAAVRPAPVRPAAAGRLPHPVDQSAGLAATQRHGRDARPPQPRHRPGAPPARRRRAEWSVTSPGGQQTTLPAAPTVAFADTDELGVYTRAAARRKGAALAPPEYFAVNLFSPAEFGPGPPAWPSPVAGQPTPQHRPVPAPAGILALAAGRGAAPAHPRMVGLQPGPHRLHPPPLGRRARGPPPAT